jgi:hypothetical protein
MANPDRPPMACLFPPITFAGIEGEAFIVRGIERVESSDGKVGAVVQEWAIKLCASLGPMGLLAPEANERRRDLPP